MNAPRRRICRNDAARIGDNMTNLVHLRTLRESGRFEREASEGKTRWSAGVDAGGLAEALGAAIQGEVRFDRGSRALYATGGSNYRQVPIGVVIPRDAADVIRTIELA